MSCSDKLSMNFFITSEPSRNCPLTGQFGICIVIMRSKDVFRIATSTVLIRLLDQ